MLDETGPGHSLFWINILRWRKSSAIVTNLDTRRYCRNSSDRIAFEKPRAPIFQSDASTHRTPQALRAKTEPTAEF